jgi:hypothetical protein
MLAERDKPFLAVIALLALTLCGYWAYRVSDAHRLALFHAHKHEYESLLGMLQHDRELTFVNGSLTTPGDPTTVGISAQRISDYRRYMADVDCASINYEPALGSALFASDTARASDILYFPAQKVHPQAHHIEDNWYLASERF